MRRNPSSRTISIRLGAHDFAALAARAARTGRSCGLEARAILAVELDGGLIDQVSDMRRDIQSARDDFTTLVERALELVLLNLNTSSDPADLRRRIRTYLTTR